MNPLDPTFWLWLIPLLAALLEVWQKLRYGRQSAFLPAFRRYLLKRVPVYGHSRPVRYRSAWRLAAWTVG
jgi:hypothetical protein